MVTWEGQARGTTNSFGTQKNGSPISIIMVGVTRRGRIWTTMCPEDFKLSWSITLLIALLDILHKQRLYENSKGVSHWTVPLLLTIIAITFSQALLLQQINHYRLRKKIGDNDCSY